MLKKLFNLIISVFILGSLSQVQAVTDYSRVSSISEAYKIVQEVSKDFKPEDVIVAVDVDNTLTEPDHPALSYWAIITHIKIFKELVYDLKPEQRDYLFRVTTIDGPQRIIENDAPVVVDKMKEDGYKVIAFTASLAGEFTDSKSKAIFKRKDTLQGMGFDFSKTFKGYTAVITFTDYPKYNGGYPTYYHGILCSNGVYAPDAGKGNVMVSFLETIGDNRVKKAGKGYFPKLIILVDDRKKNIADLESKLKAYDASIKFVGISYKGGLENPKKKINEADFRKHWENLTAKIRKEKPA